MRSHRGIDRLFMVPSFQQHLFVSLHAPALECHPVAAILDDATVLRCWALSLVVQPLGNFTVSRSGLGCGRLDECRHLLPELGRGVLGLLLLRVGPLMSRCGVIVKALRLS